MHQKVACQLIVLPSERVPGLHTENVVEVLGKKDAPFEAMLKPSRGYENSLQRKQLVTNLGI